MFYYTCIGEKEELQPVYDIFSKNERYRCTMQQELYRPEYWCEIMPAKATKANAIRKLKGMWGCDRVISFGDAVNDIPMFEISDECYAVENAVDELKAVATGIIESNEDDGVAKWLMNQMGRIQ
ncbi:MAG: HAD hydrolase family protein, partial [Lachnospiraceae bacterium]|nr:HAD hydrolase family protein [Lachnospiraceae bacterium]